MLWNTASLFFLEQSPVAIIQVATCSSIIYQKETAEPYADLCASILSFRIHRRWLRTYLIVSHTEGAASEGELLFFPTMGLACACIPALVSTTTVVRTRIHVNREWKRFRKGEWVSSGSLMHRGKCRGVCQCQHDRVAGNANGA